MHIESRAGRECCCQRRVPPLSTLGHQTAVFYQALGLKKLQGAAVQARGRAKPHGRRSGAGFGLCCAPALCREGAVEMNYFLFLNFLAASSVGGGCSVLPRVAPAWTKGRGCRWGVLTPFRLRWGSSFPLSSPQWGEQFRKPLAGRVPVCPERRPCPPVALEPLPTARPHDGDRQELPGHSPAATGERRRCCRARGALGSLE